MSDTEHNVEEALKQMENLFSYSVEEFIDGTASKSIHQLIDGTDIIEYKFRKQKGYVPIVLQRFKATLQVVYKEEDKEELKSSFHKLHEQFEELTTYVHSELI